MLSLVTKLVDLSSGPRVVCVPGTSLTHTVYDYPPVGASSDNTAARNITLPTTYNALESLCGGSAPTVSTATPPVPSNSLGT